MITYWCKCSTVVQQLAPALDKPVVLISHQVFGPTELNWQGEQRDVIDMHLLTEVLMVGFGHM